jgi:hypothetical protein
MFNADKNLVEKWTPVLDHEDAPSIGDKHKRAVTARLLENQELALQESRAHSDFKLMKQQLTLLVLTLVTLIQY